jgi:hypothetical protein
MKKNTSKINAACFPFDPSDPSASLRDHRLKDNLSVIFIVPVIPVGLVAPSFSPFHYLKFLHFNFLFNFTINERTA